MKILDGKLVSAAMREKLAKEVAQLSADIGRAPHLAAVLVGNDGASETYVASKIRNCAAAGIKSSLVRLPAEVDEETLVESITSLNEAPDVDGILVQLPLPSHISESRIIELINPAKDVDGFHPLNAGKLMLGEEGFIPATPLGIMMMLEHYKIETTGKHAVVIGRSNIVGRPVSVLLSRNGNPGNCTVTLTHSRTRNLEEICAGADIIVAALGRPGFLKAAMVKEGAVVIDVGITRVADANKKSGFAIKGDVDFEAVAPKTSFISPVPGGVGLMTIAALLNNTVKAFLKNTATDESE
jgi:methylenetetrahydrofolate dehydrogenase (NADP+)/methenyltetrahydrofolate cyclohydrolase